MTSYSLPPNLDKDIHKLEELIKKYKKGEITSKELKACRVPFGVYEQREPDTYMVRIRCAAGFVTPFQLEKIAELSSKYGTKQIHLTTRQEIQIHYLKIDNIIIVIKELREIGLASRGGGGNTVRNIIAQEDAGISSEEIFDVTPYAISLTTKLIAEDDSWTLPRKLKIAFSGTPEDKGHATISDVGFIATLKDGKEGFKVYVAGGLGAKSQEGNLLSDFIEAHEVYHLARAVKRLFGKYGNRKNKYAARLRFLWQGLGEKEFKRRFMEEYTIVKKENISPFQIEASDNSSFDFTLTREEPNDSTDFEIWKKRFVYPQKQKDLFAIIIPVELGFIDNKKIINLAKFLKSFGENVIRMTKEQNFLIRNIPERYLANVYNFLKVTIDDFNRPFILDKIVSCAGASTCQLGICLSRGASRAVTKMLKQSNMDLDRLLDVKINISGCPNACGQHPISDLGFFGKAVRKNDRLYPAYNVVAGAIISDRETKLAEKVGEVSSKDLPEVVKELFVLYLTKFSTFKDFREYIHNEGKEDLRQICLRYGTIPDFGEDKNYYFDWEADEVFSLAKRRGGECSAGLFDLIEVDLHNIQKTREKIFNLSDIYKKQQYLLDLVFYASRMLLITRAIEPKMEEEVYDGFSKHFIETGLVDPYFKDVIKIAKEKNFKMLLGKEKEVYALIERVKFLYENMDNSFRFKIGDVVSIEEEKQKTFRQVDTSFEQMDSTPKIVKDFRGTPCPMNFVKTKLAIFPLKSKEILEIWLDDGEPIENVPASVKEEGHKIVKQERVENYWKVRIEKK